MRWLKLPLVTGTLWLMAAPALAQEYQPYPSPRITQEQWARYGAEVRQNHGASLEVFEDKQLIAFSDERTLTFWVFTLKKHPAHPALITRQVHEEGGQIRVRADRVLRGIGGRVREALPRVPVAERRAQTSRRTAQSLGRSNSQRACP